MIFGISGEIPASSSRFPRRFPKRKEFSPQPGIKRLLANEILFGQKNTKYHLSLSLFFLQEQAVKSWDLPSEELVAYRSFTPFIQLLHCSMPAVQMWALWGMLHVCHRNAARYIPLLLDERITESVEQTVDPSNDGVNQLAKKLLDAVTDFKRL